MEQTWRWFGPKDPITLDEVRQAGASGIVTALHENYEGQPWSKGQIDERLGLIRKAGLEWSVVESIPIHKSIKTGEKEAGEYIGHFKDSLANVARAGVKTICYNFMPVVDWTRTDLRWQLPGGARALRFDMVDFVAYDVFVLHRKNAGDDYPDHIVRAAESRAATLNDNARNRLEKNIIRGLPGSEFSHDTESILREIDSYLEIDASVLRANLLAFLNEVVPVAEEYGARLCIHPDDPPFSLFGLPRIVGSHADLSAIFETIPSRVNGLTLCCGSLGSGPENDVEEIAETFAERIHFAHLRNVTKEPDGSFYEADHLDGDTDMIRIVATLVAEEKRRKVEGRDDCLIPFRPDHGHELLDDVGKSNNPGYSAIGRLRGLAELRGVLAAIASEHVRQYPQTGTGAR